MVYLTQGKPVFSILCEAYQGLEDILYLYNNHDELLKMFQNFIYNGEDSSLKQKRINYAKKYSFENVLKQADKILQELTPHLT